MTGLKLPPTQLAIQPASYLAPLRVQRSGRTSTVDCRIKIEAGATLKI